YDRYGHAGLEGMGMPDFTNTESIFDVFGDLLGDLFGGRRRGPRPGRDLIYAIEIDLLEAAKGIKKTITIQREENCEECGGTGNSKGSPLATCPACKGDGVIIMSQGFFRVQQSCRNCGGRGRIIKDPCKGCRGRGRISVPRTLEVGIPPGAFSGLQIAARGEGEAGQPGAPRGDLICEIRVREHSLFQRDGDNLICHVPITFSLAALGGMIEVPTLVGPMEHPLKPGLQSGDVIRIRGKGMPNLRTHGKGDLLVVIVVETPKNLTKRQEEIFRELAELDKSHVSSQRKSFFDKVKEFFVGVEASASQEKEEKES
ncbi:MAG: molecular chaperone DnaJ, partial [Bdellovibrionales bacterium]